MCRPMCILSMWSFLRQIVNTDAHAYFTYVVCGGGGVVLTSAEGDSGRAGPRRSSDRRTFTVH